MYTSSFFFVFYYQTPSSSSSLNLISEEEAVAIMTHANDCLESECSLDEVRETVRAIFRVFQLGDKASGNDYPALTKPTGYSGEVGKGSTTAYDALPPKKWKNPSP